MSNWKIERWLLTVVADYLDNSKNKSITTSPGSDISNIEPRIEILTNRDIIELFKAGFSVKFIAARVGNSRCLFQLDSAGLIDLRKNGVNEELAETMVSAKCNRTVR